VTLHDRFIRKRVENVRIASIRYLGDLAEVPARFAELRKTVEPYIAGDALRLLHWTLPTGKSDIEVTYPVSQDVNVGPVKTRTLPASEILCVHHEGPLAPPEAENSLTKTARPLYSYAVEREYLIAEGPFRLVYLEKGDELKPVKEEHRAELQMPLFLTEWLGYLSKGLKEEAGDEAQERVMAGSDAILEETEISERMTVGERGNGTLRLCRIRSENTLSYRVRLRASLPRSAHRRDATSLPGSREHRRIIVLDAKGSPEGWTSGFQLPKTCWKHHLRGQAPARS
jgi:effector-binding domain-containing protein